MSHYDAVLAVIHIAYGFLLTVATHIISIFHF